MVSPVLSDFTNHNKRPVTHRAGLLRLLISFTATFLFLTFKVLGFNG
jgi:hypothetical protein